MDEDLGQVLAEFRFDTKMDIENDGKDAGAQNVNGYYSLNLR